MPNENGFDLPITSSFDPAGTDAAAAGLNKVASTGQASSAQLGADLRRLQDEEAKASRPITPEIKPLAGAEQVESQLHKLREEAQEFLDRLKLGVSINVGERLIGGIEELGAKFKEAVTEGVNYNAEVENSVNSLASTLRSVQPEIYRTRDAAKEAAKNIFGQVQSFATESGLNVRSTFDAFSASYATFVDAGLTDTRQQVEAISTIMSAEQSKGIDGARAFRDALDLLTGRIERIPQVAAELHIIPDEFKRAVENGTQVAYLMEKLAGYKEGIADFRNSFTGVGNTVGELVHQLEGVTFAPVFAELTGELKYLKEELKKPDVQEAFRAIGHEVADVVHAGDQLLNFVLRNASAFTSLANVTVAAGAAFSGMKVLNLVSGLASLLTTAGGAAGTVGGLATAAEGAGVALGGMATISAGPLVAGIVAAGAVILKLIADMEAATQKSYELGEAFDQARPKPGRIAADATDPQAFEADRRKLLDQIAALRAIVDDPKNRIRIAGDTDADGVQIERLNQKAKDASVQMQSLLRDLNNLAAVKLGGLDISNIVPTKAAEEAKKLTAEQKASLEGINKLLDASNLKEQDKSTQLLAQKKALDDQLAAAAQYTGLQQSVVAAIHTGADFQRESAGLTDLQKAKLADYLAGIVSTRAEVDKLGAAVQKEQDAANKKYDEAKGKLADLNRQIVDQRDKLADVAAKRNDLVTGVTSAKDQQLRLTEFATQERDAKERLVKLLDEQKQKEKEIADADQKRKELAHPRETADRDAAQRELDADKLDPNKDLSPLEEEARATRRAALQARINRDNQIIAGTLNPDADKLKDPLDELARNRPADEPDEPLPPSDRDVHGRRVTDPGAGPDADNAPASRPLSTDAARRILGLSDDEPVPGVEDDEPNSTPPSDRDAQGQRVTDPGAGPAADDLDAAASKASDAAGKLSDAAGKLPGAIDDVKTAQDGYHQAVVDGINTLAGGLNANMNSLVGVVGDQNYQIADMQRSIAQLQIQVGNLANNT